MNFDPRREAEQILQELRREAAALYGAKRADELESSLAETAQSIWKVAQTTLDLTGAEPDFNA